MPLATFPPFPLGQVPVNYTSATLAIDASGEKVGYIFKVPKSGIIDKIAFRVGTVVASETLRIGLETLDASGDPSGIQYGGSAVGTQAAPATNTIYEVSLATPATAVSGDSVAVVIQFDGNIGNLPLLCYTKSIGSTGNIGFPYMDHFTTSWAKSVSLIGLLSVHYSSDNTYVNLGYFPPASLSSISFNMNSSPDERGHLISLPFGHRVWGVSVFMDLDNAADLVLYDSRSVAVRTTSLLSAERGSTGHALFEVPFTTPYDIAANEPYRLMLKPTTASNVIILRATLNSSAEMNGLPFGEAIVSTRRVDGGSFVNESANRLPIYPLISGIASPGRLDALNLL